MPWEAIVIGLVIYSSCFLAAINREAEATTTPDL